MPACAQTMIVNANLLEQWKGLMPKDIVPTSFSAAENADFSFDGKKLLFRGKTLIESANLKIKGLHNIENALASLALLRAVAGEKALTDKKVLAALKYFRAGDHRIEVFADKNGIKFIDDSKGTNPHAVIAAIAALPEPGKACILLGGLDKGMDFSPLREIAPRVRKAFLLGQCRDKMFDCLGNAFNCEVCTSFEEAVDKACLTAKQGDYVLLSPACASMDMFKDYKERGDTFKRLCLAKIGAGKSSAGIR